MKPLHYFAFLQTQFWHFSVSYFSNFFKNVGEPCKKTGRLNNTSGKKNLQLYLAETAGHRKMNSRSPTDVAIKQY